MTWIQGNMFKSLTKWHYAPARLYTGGDWDVINNIPVTDYRYLKNTVDFNELKDGHWNMDKLNFEYWRDYVLS